MHIQPIPSRPGYGATKDGKIWRTTPSHSNQHGSKAKHGAAHELKPVLNKQVKYHVVSTYAPEGGRPKVKYVHNLVAEAFLGTKPAGHVIHHKNGIRTDNRLSNLEYRPQFAKA